jgi:MFS family permease
MRRTHGYGLPVVIGASCFALSVVVFSFSHWVVVSCATGFVVGVFSVTYQTQNQTLLQVLAPPYLRGRIMSIYLLNRGTVPLGALLAGILASSFGAGNAMRIMAGVSLAIIASVVVARPEILRLKVSLRDGLERQDRAGFRPSGDTGAI